MKMLKYNVVFNIRNIIESEHIDIFFQFNYRLYSSMKSLEKHVVE